MTKQKPQGLEAIAVKRANLADADKVRYRVYRDEKDFIAVIAESALMAMKVSGISNPFRIVRDLPTEGVSIEAKRMGAASEEKISLRVEQAEIQTAQFRKTELPAENATPTDANFVPLGIRDLRKKSLSWARVLTPDMVEQAQKAAAARAEETPTVAAAPVPEPAAEATPLPPPKAEEPAKDSNVLSEAEVKKLLAEKAAE